MLTDNTIVSQTDTSLLILIAPENNFTFSLPERNYEGESSCKVELLHDVFKVISQQVFSLSLSSCFDDDQ